MGDSDSMAPCSKRLTQKKKEGERQSVAVRCQQMGDSHALTAIGQVSHPELPWMHLHRPVEWSTQAQPPQTSMSSVGR